jgi:hypothetical protein
MALSEREDRMWKGNFFFDIIYTSQLFAKMGADAGVRGNALLVPVGGFFAPAGIFYQGTDKLVASDVGGYVSGGKYDELSYHDSGLSGVFDRLVCFGKAEKMCDGA